MSSEASRRYQRSAKANANRAEYRKRPEVKRSALIGKLRREYGITIEQYEAMVARQSNRCAICDKEPKPGKRLHVDHDHKTLRVRGLLCTFCNHRLLGRGRERPEQHERAAIYLRSDFDGRRING